MILFYQNVVLACNFQISNFGDAKSKLSFDNFSIEPMIMPDRFEGENLIAQNVSVFHRGTNDMIVNPQQSITGSILSTGNVISVNQPPIVDVEEVFNGRLIFE